MKIKRIDLKVKKWFNNAWEYSKKNVLAVSVYIIFIIVLLMVLAYIIKFFGNDFSDHPSDWAHFGSYIGSVTGLLAFAGVLYSTYESKNQTKANSEKTIFNMMINSYQSQVGKIKQFKYLDNLVDASELITDYTVIAVLYKHISGLSKPLTKFDKNIENILFNLLSQSIINDDYNYKDFKKLVNKIRMNTILLNKIELPLNYYEKKSQYEAWAYKINENVNNTEIFKSLYYVISIVGESIYNKYELDIAPFIRTIYSISDFIKKSKYQGTTYHTIFAQQLSSSEVYLIFYYALSKYSSIEFITTLKKLNLFNNINANSFYPYELFILNNKKTFIDGDKYFIDTLLNMRIDAIKFDSHLFG